MEDIGAMDLLKIKNTRMELEIDPDTIAGKVPIVPDDEMWVKAATYQCFVKYRSGSSVSVSMRGPSCLRSFCTKRAT